MSGRRNEDFVPGTPADRIGLVWPLTREITSFENADAVLRALRRFGTPLHNLTKEDLLQDGTVFQIGVAPRRII
jgi:hypothetical protein